MIAQYLVFNIFKENILINVPPSHSDKCSRSQFVIDVQRRDAKCIANLRNEIKFDRNENIANLQRQIDRFDHFSQSTHFLNCADEEVIRQRAN